MDVQLKELIEKIKTEGVESAEKDASEIISDAKRKGDAIIAGAKKRADEIIAKAEKEAENLSFTGKESLRQAARDLVLELKSRVERIFKKIIENETGNVLSEEVLAEGIASILKSWGNNGVSDLEVLLPPDTLKKFEDGFKARLSAEIKKGVEIKPFPDMEAGFRISFKDGSAYYDFSAGSIARIIYRYLSPSLAEILKEEGQ